MNNAVNHLVTVSAHQRASKTYREERSRRKPCNPHEAKEKHQGSRQEQTIKDAVTHKRLLQKSVPKETVHNTKPVAALNKFGNRKAFPKFIFLFFEQNGSAPLTSAAVANFATENCI